MGRVGPVKALGWVLTALIGVTLVWVWSGERWALRAFEGGLKPTTVDSADTYEDGMTMAMTAGAGTEYVHDRYSVMDRTEPDF